jgi:hypothetical protein
MVTANIGSWGKTKAEYEAAFPVAAARGPRCHSARLFAAAHLDLFYRLNGRKWGEAGKYT